MSFGRAFRIVAVVLGAIALVMGVVSGVSVHRTRAFLADSTTASGEVVELVSRQSCDRDPDDDDREVNCRSVYAPRVRFTTVDGRTVDFLSGTASSPPSYAEGDRVQVRYRPDNPSGAKIDSVTGVWLGAIVTGSIAVVFAALCALWIVLAVRFRKL